MDRKILYDIGYGNQQPDDFLKRLKDAGIAVVMDVRRRGSSAWRNEYKPGTLARWLQTERIYTYSAGEFGNNCDALSDYPDWLAEHRGIELGALVHVIQSYPHLSLCLLCAERHAYKDGEVNCHRVHVADALVKLLGEGWEVCHL